MKLQKLPSSRLILRGNMRLLVYDHDIQGKIIVEAMHFKKLSASRVKILARRLETAVVAQLSELSD